MEESEVKVSFDGLDKIKIGDRIVGKKTGLLIPSTIVGFIPPSYRPEYHQRSRWDELYPDWRSKYVVLCEFDQPTKPIRLDELIECEFLPLPESSDCPFIQRMISDKVLFNEYADFQYRKITLVKRVCYPIDDIEIVL